MFPVTRPFRQILATALLVVLTVLPTGYVATMAWRINCPGHVRDVEVELGRQLGFQVTLADVCYPRPGEAVYRGIVLRQEEPRGKTFAELVRAEEVRLQRAERDLTLLVENPQFHVESPVQSLTLLGQLMQRSVALPFERISFLAPTCQLDLDGNELLYTLGEVAGEFLADAAAPTLKLAYHFPGAGAGTHCELTLTRDRRKEPLETSLVLKTVDGSPLPARVLNVFFDAADWLGADAKLEGALSLRQAGGQNWEADFQGTLFDVDLAKLVGRRFPRHRLTGRAQVVLQQARWGERSSASSGWIHVKGDLTAGPGTIGVELIEALTREMKFRPSSRLVALDSRRTEVDFRALGLSFELHSSGEVEIQGRLGAEFPPDAVLAGATTALLAAPRGIASVHGLFKTLFPVSPSDPGVLIPLTSESQVLLSLPVPPGSDLKRRRGVEGN
jgi:hypothetical protein